MLGRGVLAAALAACGSEAAASPVHVTLDWPRGTPLAAGRVQVLAIRTAGPTAGSLPVEAEAGPAGAVLDLSDGIWQVQAVAAGYWSQGTEVAVGREATLDARLILWPAASLHGRITTAAGESLPRDIQVRLSAAPAPASEPTAPPSSVPGAERSPSRAELRCPIVGAAWSCAGPAGMFDVELEAVGYAPRYAWDVRLGPDASNDLGPTMLRRAASVFGRAVRGDGSSPQGPCLATLEAEVTGRGALLPDADRAARGGTRVSVPLSPRGYFQVIGVPPGGHVLTVECAAASAVRELRVAASDETRLDPPLRLEELTLEIVIRPRVGPEGRPWQLTVDATEPHPRRIVDKSIVPAVGHWQRRGLTAGSYRVGVESGDGTLWLQRFFKLGEGNGPLSLRARFLGVAGRVRLRGQPLRARLAFFNEAGGEPVTLTSDDDGRFQGLLLVAPDVAETRWTVEVRAAEPPINRRLEGVRVQPGRGEAGAWLELALPIVAVRGTVVSEGGEAQIGAQVTFEETSSGAQTVVATDDAGSFEVNELPPGSYTAVAASVAGVSERTVVEVVDGIESELRLVLGRSERVAFEVVGSLGPVAGAAIQVWVAPGVPRAFTHTDPSGRFELDLPPATAEVGLTVGAPGQALKLTRLPVSPEQTITLGASFGTLVLDLQRHGRALEGATPYLVHEGAIEAAGALVGWGTPSAGVSSGGPAVVEAIEPGVYALCLADPADLAALWRGALPQDRCRAGTVEPGRTLTLSPP